MQRRLIRVVSADDDQPEVVVAVVQAIVVTGLRDHFPQTFHGALPLEPQRVAMDVVVHGGLVWRSWSMQSDVGGWAVYQSGDDGWALVLSCQWGFHESHVFKLGAGNSEQGEGFKIRARSVEFGFEQRLHLAQCGNLACNQSPRIGFDIAADSVIRYYVSNS